MIDVVGFVYITHKSSLDVDVHYVFQHHSEEVCRFASSEWSLYAQVMKYRMLLIKGLGLNPTKCDGIIGLSQTLRCLIFSQ